ncbi:4-carboxymuconolactone decarboxylase [Vibrio astriarenae]|nr:4-carboxymuconolactone decarboxylase [Vibrio sp. C7]
MTVRVAGEAWGLPLIDQKTKALISIAIDQMALNVTGEGNQFGAHVDMALKQGATYEELEELIILLLRTQASIKEQRQWVL